MALLSPTQARRVRLALPVIAAVLSACNWLASGLGLVFWSMFHERTMYNTSATHIIEGVIFASYVAVAVRCGAAAPGRVAPAITILWGLAFGWWFSFATLRLTHSLFNAVPIIDDLGGGTLWQRLSGLAMGIVGAGLITAGLLGWLTWSRRVVVLSAIVAVSAAVLSYGQSMTMWVLPLSAVVWHGAIAAILGDQILRNSRALAMEHQACPACGYSLFGLPVAAPCPECGNPPTPSAGRSAPPPGSARTP